MLKRSITLSAMAVALAVASGSAADAGARGRAPGCCGTLKPAYTHRNVYPRAHIVERRVTRVRTTRFPQYRPVIHVTRVHPTTVVHTTLVDVHRRVGYEVDVPLRRTRVLPARIVHTLSVVHRSICVCVKGSSRCR